MMRVYIIMSEADAHVDPVYAIFSTSEKAEEYVKRYSNPEEGAEYTLEAVSMEVK